MIKGIGDDAAVYRGSAEMNEVVCIDTMVEGVHFRQDTLSPFQIGKKALAINMSDLAAMGAIPRSYLVSIAVSPEWSEEKLTEIYRGMSALAKRYGMDLIGGDTVSARAGLTLTVTAIGQVEHGRMLLREYARPGDVVFVTGTVGRSAAGLNLLEKKGMEADFSREEQALVLAHQEPTPQIKVGDFWRSLGGAWRLMILVMVLRASQMNWQKRVMLRLCLNRISFL